MHTSTPRALTVGALSLAAVLTLAACGGTPPDAAPANSATASTSATASATPSPTQTSAVPSATRTSEPTETPVNAVPESSVNATESEPADIATEDSGNDQTPQEAEANNAAQTPGQVPAPAPAETAVNAIPESNAGLAPAETPVAAIPESSGNAGQPAAAAAITSKSAAVQRLLNTQYPGQDNVTAAVVETHRDYQGNVAEYVLQASGANGTLGFFVVTADGQVVPTAAPAH